METDADVGTGVLENRRHCRRGTDACVRLTPEDGGSGESGLLLADLGVGGMRVMSLRPLDVGSSVRFTLDLPRGPRLSGTARVRWGAAEGSSYAQGLEFARMGPLARRRLVKHLSPRHFGAVDWLEMLFQYATILVALLVAQNLLKSHPRALESVLEVLPQTLWLLVGGIGLLLCLRRL